MGTGISKKKLVVRVVLGLFGLLVLAAILVPLLVPTEKWQQIAFDRLKAETGLVATAESASVSLLPLGLGMKGLQVRDPENRPEWSGLEFDLAEVVVTAQLRPLFSGRFEINHVKLLRPRVVLTPTTTEDVAGTAPAGSGASEPATSLSVALAALSIEDGYVELNQADESRMILHGLSNLTSLNIEGVDGHATAQGSLDSVVVISPQGLVEVVRALEWELGVDFATDGKSGAVGVQRFSLPGVDLTGDASWQTAELTSVDARLGINADIAALANEWFRPEEIDWPEGVNPDQFGDFSGSFIGEVVVSGEVDPSATPEEMAELVEVSGKLTELRGRLLDRDDLATVHADLRFVDAKLDLDPLRIVMPTGEMAGSYSARPLSEADARLELDGDIELASAMELAAGLWPVLLPMMEEGATPPEEWPELAGAVSMQFAAEIPVDPEVEPRVTWSARAAEVKARPVDVDAEFIVRGLRMSGDAENFAVHEGTVTGPGVEMTPRLDIALSDGGTQVSGRIDAASIDLDQLQAALAPPVETAMGSWFVGVAHAAEEMWIPPADLSADLELTAQEVLASGHRLQGVSAQTSLSGQKLAVRDIRAQLGGGQINGTADVDYVQDPPAWTTAILAAEVPAAVLLAPDAPKLAGALDTKLSGDFTFGGKLLADSDAAAKALTGALTLGAAAGLLRTEPVVGSDISKFMGQYAPKWKELAFKALDAELTVDQGQVNFDRFLMSGETEVRADGMVSLDGRCDYRLDIILPAQATPDVGALQPVVDLLRDEDGRFPFAVTVTGPAAKPKVQIDFDSLQGRAEERGQEEIEDAVEDAAKKLWDKLKGKK